MDLYIRFIEFMRYNHDFHHRRSIRLEGYDYSRSGAYFITICTHNRESMFGEIVDGEMFLSELGHIARSYWYHLENQHPNLEIDESIVMPNHLHGIIVLLESTSKQQKPLSEIIRGFKTFSARQINRARKQQGISVWQRDYYEHIIRDEIELDRTRVYIINNPQNWQIDKNNQTP